MLCSQTGEFQWFFFFFLPKSLHTHLRKMRLSQKTVYQMSQTMNMPGNFWSMNQPKDFGCHCGKKSKSCSVSVEGFQVTPSIHTSYRPLFTNEFTFNSFSHYAVKVRAWSLGDRWGSCLAIVSIWGKRQSSALTPELLAARALVFHWTVAACRVYASIILLTERIFHVEMPWGTKDALGGGPLGFISGGPHIHWC